MQIILRIIVSLSFGLVFHILYRFLNISTRCILFTLLTWFNKTLDIYVLCIFFFRFYPNTLSKSTLKISFLVASPCYLCIDQRLSARCSQCKVRCLFPKVVLTDGSLTPWGTRAFFFYYCTILRFHFEWIWMWLAHSIIDNVHITARPPTVWANFFFVTSTNLVLMDSLIVTAWKLEKYLKNLTGHDSLYVIRMCMCLLWLIMCWGTVQLNCIKINEWWV